eukprot:TRINITY_DN6685_c0_g1_i1.p1 TRINITY_DN6685_c0_g1~~TRINITY_DN6685_c0_g1_i1.p1  ORF type:complete len:228 (-),score=47.29 TRINITY_DN6685_c0_g1_i1:60-716(-)
MTFSYLNNIHNAGIPTLAIIFGGVQLLLVMVMAWKGRASTFEGRTKYFAWTLIGLGLIEAFLAIFFSFSTEWVRGFVFFYSSAVAIAAGISFDKNIALLSWILGGFCLLQNLGIDFVNNAVHGPMLDQLTVEACVPYYSNSDLSTDGVEARCKDKGFLNYLRVVSLFLIFVQFHIFFFGFIMWGDVKESRSKGIPMSSQDEREYTSPTIPSYQGPPME